ncbi:MAG: hypothetical protein UT41_C0002G0016 [Candidatus Wolfebacteria bacterium GW2011_GWC2_39_22]|uniref:Uncharacterized protein n=1 Tax=Candidatus Wolfebacteria bacterium GW2011_GWC2_39_22 TaxID=1619013 RepID=A0A0G0RF16_9BACT|nr:MAG: hypothetical protein UT41_C0002G0016 [Candidatus Wolfebacteria bacterium GW2011_GWC2_39_22]HBI25877.1 hypothetical protein [Candidatus Wolfebacteria bacterium]
MLKNEQRTRGGKLICTCCNGAVEAVEARIVIDGHELHKNCGEKFSLLESVRLDLQPVISTLPENFFSRGAVLLTLSKAYTVSQFKLALFIFCEHLAEGRQWLGAQFQAIVAKVRCIIEQSAMCNALLSAIAPVMVV